MTVIINEFGDIALGRDLSVGAGEVVFEMGNGCICCTMRGDTTMVNRLANPFAPRNPLPEKSRQIKVWVRELCRLGDDVVVSVAELVCRDDGCPDIETVIGIMRPAEKIDTVRIHKPIAAVTREEVAGAVRDRNRAVPD